MLANTESSGQFPGAADRRDTAQSADALRTLLSSCFLERGNDWTAALTPRKRAERDFHNISKEGRESSALGPDDFERLHGNKKYYSVVRSSRQFLHRWLMEHVPGKVFLDYACGNGDQAIEAARLGAALSIGIDVSDVSITKARALSKGAGLEDTCIFIQDDCERTVLPDECIDVALCSGMLHHLDLSYAFPELRRILKPGGCILALEALNYNPAIALYRRFTPEMRTNWEKRHILGLKDLEFASRFFDVSELRYWHLCALLAMFARSSPRWFENARHVLDRLDAVLLQVPGLRLMAWQFTFVLTKRLES